MLPLTARLLGRLTLVLTALLGLALLTARVTVATTQAAIGPLPPPDAALTAVLAGGATVTLLTLAGAVLRVALPLLADLRTDPRRSPRRGTGRFEQAVAGVLLGAATLAPHLASAAPSHHTRGAALSATSAIHPGATSPDPAPVDPTYLGPDGAIDTPTPTPPHPQVEIHPGDTLWSIAARSLGPGSHDDAAIARTVHRIYAANESTIGTNPDVIDIGTRLVLPDLADDSGATR